MQETLCDQTCYVWCTHACPEEQREGGCHLHGSCGDRWHDESSLRSSIRTSERKVCLRHLPFRPTIATPQSSPRQHFVPANFDYLDLPIQFLVPIRQASGMCLALAVSLHLIKYTEPFGDVAAVDLFLCPGLRGKHTCTL